MKLRIKHFSKLTTEELFKIYELRISVFVVEQNCPYQEVDEIDRDAYHIWFEENNQIVAYARIFLEEGVAHIGRVIAVKRRCGLGTRIVQACMDCIQKKYAVHTIQLEAQVYAKGLYEKVGFQIISDVFLEDGIEHVRMEMKI